MNKFIEHIDEEEEILDAGSEPRLKSEEPAAPQEKKEFLFIKQFFTQGVVSKEAATDALPFIVFLCLLGMVYIANSHFAINNVRKIDKLSKEVKELNWDYKSLKADLMFRSKLTEVAKKVDTLGLRELTEPPKKIVISKNEH